MQSALSGTHPVRRDFVANTMTKTIPSSPRVVRCQETARAAYLLQGVIGFGDQKYVEPMSIFSDSLGLAHRNPRRLMTDARVQTPLGTPAPRSRMVSGSFYSRRDPDPTSARLFLWREPDLGRLLEPRTALVGQSPQQVA